MEVLSCQKLLVREREREREREIIPVILYDRVFISILHVRVYRVNEAGDNPIAGDVVSNIKLFQLSI